MQNATAFPEERRLATVLFADIQGFTALSEQLDYETVSDLIKDIWSRLDAIIESHAGYIDKHMGDGVMAVWGAPFAGDKDAENAVNAAIELIDAINKYTHKSGIRGVAALKLRIGINSGQVFAGYVGTRNEYTVIGDTVNIAARLEQAAEPGAIIVGEPTCQLLHQNFRLRSLPPILAKGKTDPIVAYQVEGKQGTGWKVAYESLNRLETNMVCRDNEMSRLQAYYSQARLSPSPVMVLVTGEVGIGKSRLLMEFVRKLEMDEPSARIVSVRALAQMSRLPFYAWKLIFFQLLGLQDTTPTMRWAQKFEQEITRLWPSRNNRFGASEAARIIGKLIEIEFPEQQQAQTPDFQDAEEELVNTFEMVCALFEACANDAPLVLVIDDLQWADRESLNLLLYILQAANHNLPMLIVAGARLNLLRDHPKWWTVSHIVTIGPLPVSGQIVAEAYPDLQGLPDNILKELAHRAEGNPFFLEEIVKGMLNAGLDEIKSSPEEAISRLQFVVPESLRATLQARLDSLSREAHTVALMASVVGRVFWVGALKSVARVNTGTGTLTAMPELVMDRLIQDGLRQLVRAELAFPRAGTKFTDAQEYIFKNSYLRDVAYSMIPLRSRSIYHRAVARWLSDHSEIAYKVMAAEHYEKAGVFFDAAEQYEQAIDMARTRGAQSEIESLKARAKEAREAGRKAAQNG